MTRSGARVSTAVVVAALLGGCGSDSGDGGADGGIRLGLVTDLSGPFVTVGKDIEGAVKVGVDEVNADGGIDGAKLAVETVDTSSEPPQALTGYRELRDEDVVAVLGPITSGEAQVAFGQAGALRVPIVTGTANEEGLTDAGDGWAFRNTATNSELYDVALPAWAREYSVKSAVLAYDEETSSSVAAAEVIPEVARRHGVDVVNADDPVTFRTGQTDFSSVVQRIRDTDADALIVLSLPTEGGLIARELARQGETRPVLGNAPQGGASFFKGGGKTIRDWVLPAIFDPNRDDAKTASYVKRIADADPEPPTVPEAVNYYDAVLMIAEALRESGVTPDTPVDEAREAVREGLSGLSGFEGAQGTTSFDGGPEATKDIYVKVVQEGETTDLR